jgi:hypothetical protein
MRFRAQLLSGLLTSLSLACGGSSTAPTDVAAFGVSQPAALQQIDRVSLLAWKETLGPQYPLTVSRADSINAIIDFFSTPSAGWTESATLTGCRCSRGSIMGIDWKVSGASSSFRTAPADFSSFRSEERSTAGPRRPAISLGF